MWVLLELHFLTIEDCLRFRPICSDFSTGEYEQKIWIELLQLNSTSLLAIGWWCVNSLEGEGCLQVQKCEWIKSFYA